MIRPPSPEVVQMRNEIVQVLQKYRELNQQEVLAALSYTVGQCIALQDQNKMTPAMCMEVVHRNIEAGNQHVIKQLTQETPAGNA